MSVHDNYISPYGFSVIADAIIDVIAERRGMSTNEISGVVETARGRDSLHEDNESYLDSTLYPVWYQEDLEPAIKAMEDILFPGEIADDGMEGA